MSKVAFHTLGCKVNQNETESIQGLFAEAGYEIVGFDEPSDIYVINTCTVTNVGDRKSRQMIRQALRRNPNAFVVVTGCYAQIAPDSVLEIPGVDLVVGTQNRQNIVSLVQEAMQKEAPTVAVNDIMNAKEFEEIPFVRREGRTRATLKIQEGCQQFCSYCIIPYTRGPFRSRRMDNILEQAERIARQGFPEIVLAGIHLGMYGVDLPDKPTLADVIRLIEPIEGIRRIRLSSIDPTDISDDLINTIKDFRKVCPHLHIPLQSGSDAVLAAMNRPYDTGRYYEIIASLRKAVPEISISTDVIVGFPGETDEQFAETLKFIEEIGFSRMHIFKYSPRTGTPAARMSNQVKAEIKDARSKRLSQLAETMSLEFHRKFIGKTEEVLFEHESTGMTGLQEGLTKNYVRVVASGNMQLSGVFASVLLENATAELMYGRIINQA